MLFKNVFEIEQLQERTNILNQLNIYNYNKLIKIKMI